MKHRHLPAILTAFLLAAAPAFAGGIVFDIPRLDFPAPQPEITRDCQAPDRLSPTCAPTRQRRQPALSQRPSGAQ
jgi:hypothetical protein